MLRYTIYFSGHVQGVGFRYTATELAANYKVAGYVENLPDRRVLLVAEGESDQLEGLVADIRRAMGRYIQGHTIDQAPATGEFGEPEFGGLRVRR